MKKSLKSVLTIFTALAIAFNLVPATTPAKAATTDTAYIMLTDDSWTTSLQMREVDGWTRQDATITGPGDYTVGIDFTGTDAGYINGINFAALGIITGEKTFPGYTIKINSIKINGNKIDFTKGYTCSDDQTETRMNLFNTWVSVPLDDSNGTFRSYDGTYADASPTIVSQYDFEEVKTLSINFTYSDGIYVPETSSKLTLSKSKVTVTQGESVTLTYKPSDAKSVTVKSANTKVATVKKSSAGKIKITVPKSAKKGASTTITVTSGKLKATVKVTVKK